MAERVGARFAFDDEAVVITVYYDDATGHPTRILSVNSGEAIEVTFTLATKDRVFTNTRTVPSGTVDYNVPTNLGSRIDFMVQPPNVYLAATHSGGG